MVFTFDILFYGFNSDSYGFVAGFHRFIMVSKINKECTQGIGMQSGIIIWGCMPVMATGTEVKILFGI